MNSPELVNDKLNFEVVKDDISVFSINDNFEIFKKKTQVNFDKLKDFLLKEFTNKINALEER